MCLWIYKKLCCTCEVPIIETVDQKCKKYEITEVQYNTMKNVGITDKQIESMRENQAAKGTRLYTLLMKQYDYRYHQQSSRYYKNKKIDESKRTYSIGKWETFG